MHGVLVVDKPVGPTSHDVVGRVRRILGEQRIGHTGTLDPAASGVLPLVVGRATRLARFLTAGDKTYEAVIRLGFATETGDAEGAPLGPPCHGPLPPAEQVAAALTPFRGRFLQQPPAYSAKKIDGRRSYEIARTSARRNKGPAGTSAPESELPRLAAPVAVTVHAVDVLQMEGDRVTLHVSCSAGFYVRSLAKDLGDVLGTGGHLVGLRRTRSGDYALADAVTLDAIEHDREAAIASLVPLAAMLPHLSMVVLTPEGLTHALHGRDLGPADVVSRLSPVEGEAQPGEAELSNDPDRWIRLLTADGELLGLARAVGDTIGGPPDSSGLLHPSLVLR